MQKTVLRHHRSADEVTGEPNDPRSWSYKAVTEAAEKRIRSLIESSNPQPSDAHKGRIYREWAYGVYLGWSALTTGWQDEGDDARLEALVKPSAE